MDSLETTASFTDNLLDFSSDLSSDDNDDNISFRHPPRPAFSLIPCPPPSFPEYVEEEELEWISNKDAFPMVESFVDIIPNHPSISSTTTLGNNNNNSNNSNSSLLSPVSVLENSSTSFTNSTGNGRSLSGAGAIAAMISLTGIFKVPGKARSKQLRRRRKEMNGEGFRFWEKVKPCSKSRGGVIGRKCLHCGSDKTPQWRAGPLGPKTLCNACGVRYKSGRLVPEYRPASSPTFSSELHSNSHRKIVEMRKQKTVMGVGVIASPSGVS